MGKEKRGWGGFVQSLVEKGFGKASPPRSLLRTGNRPENVRD